MRRLVWSVLWLAACDAPGEPVDPPDTAPVVEDPAPLEVTADALRARLAGCARVVGGPFAADDGDPAEISLCAAPGAVVWRADLDVDCDGKRSAACNARRDPGFSRQTAATDAHGEPLDAAALPFVVIPAISPRFDFRAAGLGLGSVVAVVHGDRVVFGPIADVGPADTIGEASYAMAEALGLDPDPAAGGAARDVLYVAFTGPGASLPVIEDHDAATWLGDGLARELLAAP